MRLLKAGELDVVAGGLDEEFDDFGDDSFSSDGVTVRGRRPKKKKSSGGTLRNIIDRWGEAFDPAKLACPNAFGEFVFEDEKLEEVVVEGKKISPDQVRDFGALFPQPTDDGKWTGWSDMKQSWGDLFKSMSMENIEAIRQALAEMIETAMELGNSVAVAQLCLLVNLTVKAMTGEGNREALGSSFGEGLFHVHGKTGVSLLPIANAFEGR